MLNNDRCIALINGLFILARGEQERQRHEPVAFDYNVPDGELLARLRSDGRLTISNTGPVIGEQDAERLFEPFYRGTGRTGRTDGAGLGLSIVRAVAASHSGQATARSLSGGGLAVEVCLPTTF